MSILCEALRAKVTNYLTSIFYPDFVQIFREVCLKETKSDPFMSVRCYTGFLSMNYCLFVSALALHWYRYCIEALLLQP